MAVHGCRCLPGLCQTGCDESAAPFQPALSHDRFRRRFRWELALQAGVLAVGQPEIPERIRIPDGAHLLAEEIRPFTTTIQDAAYLSFIQGAGHGGSHPHLVNEFLRALLENRDPWPNATQSANWTCTGICAHQSAMRGGEIVRLPTFTLG